MSAPYAGLGQDDSRPFPIISSRFAKTNRDGCGIDGQVKQTVVQVGRRSRLEVIFDILEVVGPKDGLGPTTIMFRANISWKVLRESTSYLTDQGILANRKDGAREKLALTPLGVRLLEMLRAIRALLLAGGDSAPAEPKEVFGRLLTNLHEELGSTGQRK